MSVTAVFYRTWRLPALVGVVLGGLLLGGGARLLGGANWFNRRAGQWLIQNWMQALNLVLGLRVQVRCQPLSAPVLMVANHISWLDVSALASIIPATFIAKADVRQWPLLGGLAALAGTQFLDRNSVAAVRPLLNEISDRLRSGARCAVFPEGTSTVGDRVRPMFPALFQAAIDAGCPIQPVAIEYPRGAGRDTLAPFIGDQTLGAHIWALLAQAHTDVDISFLAPIEVNTADRRSLARHTQQSLEHWLFPLSGPMGQAVGSWPPR